MNKYLLPTAYFLVFGTVGGSSPSYAMDPEFEEGKQSIVVYNPQGQKIRKVPLYRENPKADNHLHRYGKAPIIVLLGTSTAGKSTLINPIKAKYPSLKDYSIDLRWVTSMADILKDFFPEDYNTLNAIVEHENILPICSGDEIKGNFSSQQLSKAREAAKKFDEIISNPVLSPAGFNEACSKIKDKDAERLIDDSLNGSPIILDTVGFRTIQRLFLKNFHADAHIMITFCPLKELSARMTKRNEKAKASQQESNIREGFPLWQFTQLYKPRVDQKEPLLQVLTRQDCIDAYRLHLGDKMNDEAKFLKTLGFISSDIEQVEITTRAPYYHSIFNTETSELIIISK